MSKKYLSLEEAAQMLSLAPEELVRLRERGDVRGFADRGTWKFKHEDVESLLRRRQADSNPEVPLMGGTPPKSRPDMGEQPTVIRRDRVADRDEGVLTGSDDKINLDSDSDVKLVGGKELDLDFEIEGDSDVKLVGLGRVNSDNLGTDPEIPIKKPGSDSDVRLVRTESDSDVKLPGEDSDSDVHLVGGATELEISLKDDGEGGTDHDLKQKSVNQFNSDSDVKLVPDDSTGGVGDVTLIDDDDAIAIDFTPDSSRQASVLDDESGISLGRDSSLLLGESGISLGGPNDSGIALHLNDDDDGLTLALDDDSGISLDAGESGISLEAADSGISLESAESGISLADDSHAGTVPMMDLFADDDSAPTQFEVAALDEDSSFDMRSGAKTHELDISDDSASDAVFDLDEDQDTGENQFDEAEMDLEADQFEEEEDLDVFDADEEAFEGAGAEAFGPAAASRGVRTADAEWGTPTFVGLALGSVLMILCGVVMVDLVKNTSTAATPNPVSGQLLQMLGGLYK